jgi:hypothetical protein
VRILGSKRSFWHRLRRRQKARINVRRPLPTCFGHADSRGNTISLRGKNSKTRCATQSTCAVEIYEIRGFFSCTRANPSLYPERIDLGLGRAPGSDQRTRCGVILPPTRRNSLAMYWNSRIIFRPSPRQAVHAVPGTGLEVPLWIPGSSLFPGEAAKSGTLHGEIQIARGDSSTFSAGCRHANEPRSPCQRRAC